MCFVKLWVRNSDVALMKPSSFHLKCHLFPHALVDGWHTVAHRWYPSNVQRCMNLFCLFSYESAYFWRIISIWPYLSVQTKLNTNYPYFIHFASFFSLLRVLLLLFSPLKESFTYVSNGIVWMTKEKILSIKIYVQNLLILYQREKDYFSLKFELNFKSILTFDEKLKHSYKV